MNILANNPEFWASLGLSPVVVMLIAAIAGLWTYFKIAMSEQKKLREDWHAETRAEVQDLSTRLGTAEHHILVCEKDRIHLSTQNESLIREMDTMKILVASYRTCTVVECPVKAKIGSIPVPRA